MDFEDSPEEAEFRREVRTWLEANAPKESETHTGRGMSLDDARAWQAKKAEARYAKITWPVEYGGRGGKPIETVIYSQEERNHRAVAGADSYFSIGLGMCIPTLMAYGSEADKVRYVQPALHGEEIWCQLFSEPAAGSDVAGILTRAERDGDDWVLNGQKIWTSGAQYSDYGIVITRTDPSAPKHKGLTMFYLDMKTPGVEVRPIKQANGSSEFNEVFFTDVRIPDAQRLGEPGTGWKVALTTLMHERQSVSGMGGGFGPLSVLHAARKTSIDGKPAIQDASIRERIADAYVADRGLLFTNYRRLTALSHGQQPGPEQSIHKIVRASQGQKLGSLTMDLYEEAGLLSEIPGPWKRGEAAWLYGAGIRIAGGTDEILRNIIAERVLGLPPEIRVDKDLPFQELAEQQRKAS